MGRRHRRRTLVHLPSTPTDVEVRVGDTLITLPDHGSDKGVLLEIVEVDHVLLCQFPLRDWALLNLPDDNLGLDAYRARWDATNPDVPWETNPTVWRVVFRYLDKSAEFAQAT